MTAEQALAEIERNRGTQFHPDLCDLFNDLFGANQDKLAAMTHEYVQMYSTGYVPFNSRGTAMEIPATLCS